MNAYFPARVRAASALYLPRLIVLGAVLATVGVVTGLDRVPGGVTLGDFASMLTCGLGLALIGWGVRPEEGTDALALLARDAETLVSHDEPGFERPVLRLVADLAADETGDLTPVA